MKSFLKNTLTPRQYRSLAQFKMQGIRACSHFFLFWLKRLPTLILINIKSGLIITRKMDYTRPIDLMIDSELEYQGRLHSCKKEPDTVRWIETFFQPGDVFYDIGANVGAYALVACQFLNQQVTVYAFEPAFLNFTQLCKNIILNQCETAIVPLQIALSDRTQLDTFHYHDLTPGGALHALGSPETQQGTAFQPVVQQSILSYQMDDLITCFNLPIPNHIKLDVDGIELSVLKGAEKTLTHPQLRTIILELEAGEKERQIVELLQQKGFVIHQKSPKQFANAFDFIFVRNSAPLASSHPV